MNCLMITANVWPFIVHAAIMDIITEQENTDFVHSRILTVDFLSRLVTGRFLLSLAKIFTSTRQGKTQQLDTIMKCASGR